MISKSHEYHSYTTGLYTSSELPTNRSGFVVQNNNEVLSNTPSDSLPVVIITTFALIAGVFAVVFFLIIFVLVSYRICKQERRNYLQLAQSQSSEIEP